MTDNDYMVLTTSYDGTAKIWDERNMKNCVNELE